MKKCPCGSGKSYTVCCEIFITGKELPASPEQLMRSRYTAYSQANVEYIADTMKSPAADGFDKPSARAWAKSIIWVKLDVLNSSINGSTGFVEFNATYLEKRIKQHLHEISEFHLIDGRWYYTNGQSG